MVHEGSFWVGEEECGEQQLLQDLYWGVLGQEGGKEEYPLRGLPQILPFSSSGRGRPLTHSPLFSASRSGFSGDVPAVPRSLTGLA